MESIEAQRRDMIAAAYSNPNWDSKENVEKRKEYLQDLNRHFNEAIVRVYEPKGKPEPEIDWNNPFYAAHKREIAKTRERFQWAIEGKTAGEILELEEERSKRRNGSESEPEQEPEREHDQQPDKNKRERDYDQMPDDEA